MFQRGSPSPHGNVTAVVHTARFQPCLCVVSSREELAFVSVRFTKGQRAPFWKKKYVEKICPLMVPSPPASASGLPLLAPWVLCSFL